MSSLGTTFEKNSLEKTSVLLSVLQWERGLSQLVLSAVCRWPLLGCKCGGGQNKCRRPYQKGKRGEKKGSKGGPVAIRTKRPLITKAKYLTSYMLAIEGRKHTIYVYIMPLYTTIIYINLCVCSSFLLVYTTCQRFRGTQGNGLPTIRRRMWYCHHNSSSRWWLQWCVTTQTRPRLYQLIVHFRMSRRVVRSMCNTIRYCVGINVGGHWVDVERITTLPNFLLYSFGIITQANKKLPPFLKVTESALYLALSRKGLNATVLYCSTLFLRMVYVASLPRLHPNPMNHCNKKI